MLAFGYQLIVLLGFLFHYLFFYFLIVENRHHYFHYNRHYCSHHCKHNYHSRMEDKYLLPQITLATSSKVVVRLYFNKNQQKCWFKTKERLPTTPFFTQHLSQFSDLSKHTHAIYHLTENLILNHFFYTRKLQIKQHMQLKSTDIFYLFCQK